MKKNLLPIINSGIKYGLLTVAFLIPIFFLDTFVDVFEFPKQLVLVIVTTVLAILWFTKFILEKEVRITKTPLDWPILGFLAVYILSTYFSSNQYTSLAGFFSRYHFSLISVISYVLLYYIASSNLKSVKEVLHLLYAFLLSSGLLALLGVFQYFGLYILGWEPSKIRNFSPIGSPSSLLLILAMAIPLVLVKIMYVKDMVQKSLLSVFVVLLTLPIILINLTGAWVALLVGVVTVGLFNNAENFKKNKIYLASILGVVVVVALLNYLPFSKDVLTFLKVDYSKEVQLDAKNSWAVTTSTLRDYPILGSGPATFLYDFTRYRPATFNLSNIWDKRFVVSHNDYLQILTTIGIAGLFAYLFLTLRFIFFALSKTLKGQDSNEHTLKVGLTASVAAFFVGTLFVSSTTAVFSSFIVLLGALMALEKLVGKDWVTDLSLSLRMARAGATDKSTEIMPYLVTVPGVILAIILLFFTYKFSIANYYYRASLDTFRADNGRETLRLQGLAVTNNPYESVYHVALAQTSLLVANNLAAKKDVTAEEKDTITKLLDQAVREARTASVINPLHISNWESLASIYRSLAAGVQGAADWSLQAFQSAVNIDPPNPQLRLDIGGIFYAAQLYDQAITQFQQAVSLKPNLANAHYNLANAFKQAKRYNEAFLEYQTTLSLISAESEDANKVRSEMDEIKDKVQFTQPQTQQQPQQQEQSSEESSFLSTKSAAPEATRSLR